MNTEPKVRKKSFTIVEQAIHQVRGFRNLYQEPGDKIRLSGQSESTLKNYERKLALFRLKWDTAMFFNINNFAKNRIAMYRSHPSDKPGDRIAMEGKGVASDRLSHS